jgi:putative zinc finger/helix-turn-helix YgiT family protein
MQGLSQAHACGLDHRHYQHPIIPSATKMKNQCPFCLSENSLKEMTYPFSAHPMPGHTVDIQLRSMTCMHCDEQIETPEIAISNNTLISDAKLEWLVSNIELDKSIGYLVRELRINMGVTQSKFSEMTGAKGVSISKYELHIVKPSALARTLFIVLARSKEARESLVFCSKADEVVASNVFEWSYTAPHELITIVNDQSMNSTPTATAPSIISSIVEFIDQSLLRAVQMVDIGLSASNQSHMSIHSTKTRNSLQNLVSVY